YLSGDLATHVALMRNSPQRNPLAELTPRELETLTLVAEGKPYGQIADELNVSYKTVVNVCYQLRQKLEARNLQDLVLVAIKLRPSMSHFSCMSAMPPALPDVPLQVCRRPMRLRAPNSRTSAGKGSKKKGVSGVGYVCARRTAV